MPRASALVASLIFAVLAAPDAQAAKHFDKGDQDTTCAPCKDFDQYANGGWRAKFVMPASYSRYGAFTEVADRNQQVLLGIVTKAAAAKAKAGSDQAKLGDYWSSCMDSTAAEAAGLKPVQPLLTAVDGMASVSDLGRQVAWFHAHGVGAVFAWFGNQDPKNSDRFIVHAGQGGLHLCRQGSGCAVESLCRRGEQRGVAVPLGRRAGLHPGEVQADGSTRRGVVVA